jgi:hypothetical protein
MTGLTGFIRGLCGTLLRSSSFRFSTPELAQQMTESRPANFDVKRGPRYVTRRQPRLQTTLLTLFRGGFPKHLHLRRAISVRRNVDMVRIFLIAS